MIKKYLVLIMEGAVYGFFGGALIWINWYLIYETYLSIAKSQKLDKINMSFMPFPVEFLGLCLFFMILTSVIRLMIEFFFQKYNHLFSSWLLTGVISVVVINLILSSEPVVVVPQTVGYGWLCCLDNSTGYLFWLIPFLLIILYTFLFVLVRNFIMGMPKLLK